MTAGWQAGRATVAKASCKLMWRMELGMNACAPTDDPFCWHARCSRTRADTGTQANSLHSFFWSSGFLGKRPKATGDQARESHLHHAPHVARGGSAGSSERHVRSRNARSKERVELVPEMQRPRDLPERGESDSRTSACSIGE